MPYRIDPEDIHQVPARLHVEDYRLLQKVLADEEMSFQEFIRVCVQIMLDGPPQFLQLLGRYRDALDVRREKWKAHSLSQRERLQLLKEIENDEKVSAPEHRDEDPGKEVP